MLNFTGISIETFRPKNIYTLEYVFREKKQCAVILNLNTTPTAVDRTLQSDVLRFTSGILYVPMNHASRMAFIMDRFHDVSLS